MPRHVMFLMAGLLTLGPGCAGPSDEEATPAWVPDTISHDSVVEVQSPFGAELNALWLEHATRHRADLAPLLLADPPVPFVVQLVPAPEDEAAEEEVDQVADMLMSTERTWPTAYPPQPEGGVAIYVDPDGGLQALTASSPLLRRQMARALLAHTPLVDSEVGELPHWFAEGLADVAASVALDEVGDAHWDDLVPEVVIQSRRIARPGFVAELLAWQDPAEVPVDAWVNEHRRHVVAMAFCYHLMREGGGPFADRAGAVAALGDEDLLAAEGPFLVYITELDVYGQLADAAASGTDLLRRAAFDRMLAWQNQVRHGAIRAARFVQLAAAALQDSVVRGRASRFMISLPPQAVPEELVAELVGSSDALTALTGQALLLAREEPVDRARVEELWAGVAPGARTTDFAAVALVLELD